VAAYEKGDYTTALQILRPRAEQGNAKAQYNLGAMYANGLGVPQDYATTVSWYRRAAEQGLVEAQCKLGVMYAKGQGVLHLLGIVLRRFGLRRIAPARAGRTG
jgi:uncharacterized protein